MDIMQVSKLDEIYSLSSKMTRKEMVQRYANYTEIDISHKQEPMKYIDQYTDKVKSELRILRDKCPLCSSKNISFLFIKHGFDHMPVHIGKTPINAVVPEGQEFVVEAEKMKYGCMQIVNGQNVFDRLEAELIGRAEADARFDSSAG